MKPDLEMIRGGKKEPCVYCGEAPHPAPLACERIIRIEVSEETGSIIGIEFSPFWRLAGVDPAG